MLDRMKGKRGFCTRRLNRSNNNGSNRHCCDYDAGTSGIFTFLLGVVLWFIFYKKFWDEVYNDASSVVGPIDPEDGGIKIAI